MAAGPLVEPVDGAGAGVVAAGAGTDAVATGGGVDATVAVYAGAVVVVVVVRLTLGGDLVTVVDGSLREWPGADAEF